MYVCGDVNMAADVADTTTLMLKKYLRINDEQAEEYMQKLKVSRFNLPVFYL